MTLHHAATGREFYRLKVDKGQREVCWSADREATVEVWLWVGRRCVYRHGRHHTVRPGDVLKVAVELTLSIV